MTNKQTISLTRVGHLLANHKKIVTQFLIERDKLNLEFSQIFSKVYVRVKKEPIRRWEGNISRGKLFGRIVFIQSERLDMWDISQKDKLFSGEIMRLDMTDTLVDGRINLKFDEFEILIIQPPLHY